jgi:hypothetical protein
MTWDRAAEVRDENTWSTRDLDSGSESEMTKEARHLSLSCDFSISWTVDEAVSAHSSIAPPNRIALVLSHSLISCNIAAMWKWPGGRDSAVKCSSDATALHRLTTRTERPEIGRRAIITFRQQIIFTGSGRCPLDLHTSTRLRWHLNRVDQKCELGRGCSYNFSTTNYIYW